MAFLGALLDETELSHRFRGDGSQRHCAGAYICVLGNFSGNMANNEFAFARAHYETTTGPFFFLHTVTIIITTGKLCSQINIQASGYQVA